MSTQETSDHELLLSVLEDTRDALRDVMEFDGSLKPPELGIQSRPHLDRARTALHTANVVIDAVRRGGGGD